MAGPGQNSLMATRRRKWRGLAWTAALELKRTPALSGGIMGAIDSDSEEDLRSLPQEKAYVLAISDAVKHVTGDCDATRYFQPIHFKARLDGPDTPPFSCDQPTLAAPRDGLRPASAPGDAGSVLSVYVQISDFVTKVLIRKRFRRLALPARVNQLRNMALGMTPPVPKYPHRSVGGAGFRGPSFASTNFSTGWRCLWVGVYRLDELLGECRQRRTSPVSPDGLSHRGIATRQVRCCLPACWRSGWNCAETRD